MINYGYMEVLKLEAEFSKDDDGNIWLTYVSKVLIREVLKSPSVYDSVEVVQEDPEEVK